MVDTQPALVSIVARNENPMNGAGGAEVDDLCPRYTEAKGSRSLRVALELAMLR